MASCSCSTNIVVSTLAISFYAFRPLRSGWKISSSYSLLDGLLGGAPEEIEIGVRDRAGNVVVMLQLLVVVLALVISRSRRKTPETPVFNVQTHPVYTLMSAFERAANTIVQRGAGLGELPNLVRYELERASEAERDEMSKLKADMGDIIKTLCGLAPGWAQSVASAANGKAINIFLIPHEYGRRLSKRLKQLAQSPEFGSNSMSTDLEGKIEIMSSMLVDRFMARCDCGTQATKLALGVLEAMCPNFPPVTLACEVEGKKILRTKWRVESHRNTVWDVVSGLFGVEGTDYDIIVLEAHEAVEREAQARPIGIGSGHWKSIDSKCKGSLHPESTLFCHAAQHELDFYVDPDCGYPKMEVALVLAHEVGHWVSWQLDQGAFLERLDKTGDILYSNAEEEQNIGICPLDASQIGPALEQSLTNLESNLAAAVGVPLSMDLRSFVPHLSPFVPLDDNALSRLKDDLRPAAAPVGGKAEDYYISVTYNLHGTSRSRKIFRCCENLVRAELYWSLKEKHETSTPFSETEQCFWETTLGLESRSAGAHGHALPSLPYLRLFHLVAAEVATKAAFVEGRGSRKVVYEGPPGNTGVKTGVFVLDFLLGPLRHELLLS